MTDADDGEEGKVNFPILLKTATPIKDKIIVYIKSRHLILYYVR